MKTFTLDEAQALLPVLESLLRRALDDKRSAEEAASELSELTRRITFSGGFKVDVGEAARLRATLESHLKRVQESIAEIASIGAQVKDLDAGQLDFPCRLDGQIVLLCWRMGEPVIEHWRPQDAASHNLQPVDERFGPRGYSGGRPN